MPKQKGLNRKGYNLLPGRSKITRSHSGAQITEKTNSARYIGVKIKISSKNEIHGMKLQTVRNLSSAKIKILIAGGENIDKKISDANDSLFGTPYTKT